MPGISPTYQNIWDAGTSPSTFVTPGVGQFFLRLTAFTRADVKVFGIRFFRDISDGGNHIGWIAFRNTSALRTIERVAVFPHNVSGSGSVGWQSVYFGKSLFIPSGTWFDVIGLFTGSHWSENSGALAGGNRFVSANGLYIVPTDGAVDPFGNTVVNGAWDTIIRLNPQSALPNPSSMVGLDVISLAA